MDHNNPIVYDAFGQAYELIIGHNQPSNHSLVACVIGNHELALQFIAGLGLADHQWRRLLNGLETSNPHQSVLARAASLFSNGLIRFFKLPNLIDATPIPVDQGKALVFSAQGTQARSISGAENIAIKKRTDAEKYVGVLSQEQLEQALRDTGLDISHPQNTTPRDPTHTQEMLVKALVSGDASVWRIDHRPHAPSNKSGVADVSTAAEIPGNREVPLGPEPTTSATVYKREHTDGATRDPYTLQTDGKPLGAKEGVMPREYIGLKALPANHNQLVEEGFPDLDFEFDPGKFAGDYKNFLTAEPVVLSPGTKIYRIVDEKAALAGSYWALALPAGKAEWRSNYAVKDSWNDNGYFTEYTVPEGEGLKVWKGRTAGQEYLQHNNKEFYLEGGDEQLFLTRDSISPLPKKHTQWEDAKL